MIRRLKTHLLLALIFAGTAMVANGDDKIPPPDIRVENFWPNPFGVNYTVTVNLKGMLNAKGVQNEQLKGDYTLEKLIPFINGVPVRNLLLLSLDDLIDTARSLGAWSNIGLPRPVPVASRAC